MFKEIARVNIFKLHEYNQHECGLSNISINIEGYLLKTLVASLRLGLTLTRQYPNLTCAYKLLCIVLPNAKHNILQN